MTHWLDKCLIVLLVTFSCNASSEIDSDSNKAELKDGETNKNCQPGDKEDKQPLSNPIFAETFEHESIEAMLENWNDRKNTKGMSFSDDVPEKSKGKQSLLMTYVAGENEGGHLFKEFPEGYDSLFARFYVKFLTRETSLHHFVKLGGYNPSVGWPQGFAGMKPAGDDFFISGIESPSASNWDWGFYTYWMHMNGSPEAYWGNVFYPEEPKEVALDQWICVEFMLKLNDPVEEKNGEMAFWIDGKKILHLGEGFPLMDRRGGFNKENAEGELFEGFQWRNCDQLKLTFFWLNYYMTKGEAGAVDKVLFDELVVSTEYIGPLK
ncbi:MAG: hypothetical protein KI791_20870 [Cyclobacteriaceae bacterium]|nr:hypothetical protein [Cyclobacteriaceae bacterium SS2]